MLGILPACTLVSPSAIDQPASVDNSTGLLFRSSCGITNFTVSQCPYLCSRAGGGFFKECSNQDLSGDEPIDQFPPIECTHCLPPCHFSNVSVHATSTTFAAVLQTAATSVLAGSSTPTCTTVNSTHIDRPASVDNTTGLLYRASCGTSDFSVAQCPNLCGEQLPDGNSILACTGFGGFPFSDNDCHRCLPPCSSTNYTTIPAPTCTVVSSFVTDTPAFQNPALNGTGPFFRAQCGLVRERLMSCSVSDEH